MLGFPFAREGAARRCRHRAGAATLGLSATASVALSHHGHHSARPAGTGRPLSLGAATDSRYVRVGTFPFTRAKRQRRVGGYRADSRSVSVLGIGEQAKSRCSWSSKPVRRRGPGLGARRLGPAGAPLSYTVRSMRSTMPRKSSAPPDPGVSAMVPTPFGGACSSTWAPLGGNSAGAPCPGYRTQALRAPSASR